MSNRILAGPMANVGWAVEAMAENVIGQSFDRLEQYQRKQSTEKTEPGIVTGVLPRYRLGSTVPDYWISSFPMSLGQDNLRRLKRAAVPRIENDQIKSTISFVPS
jgi:hypothetical protein